MEALFILPKIKITINILCKSNNDICHFKSMTKCSILNLINLLILN